MSLLNKADDPHRVEQARELAAELRRGGAQRVVVAALEAADAVIDVTGTETT